MFLIYYLVTVAVTPLIIFFVAPTKDLHWDSISQRPSL